jgi:hypothetical protein
VCVRGGRGAPAVLFEQHEQHRLTQARPSALSSTLQLIANPAWVGTVEVLDPAGGGVAASAEAIADARAHIADPRSWVDKSSAPRAHAADAQAAAASGGEARAPLIPGQPFPAGEPAAVLMLQAQVTAYMGAL